MEFITKNSKLYFRDFLLNLILFAGYFLSGKIGLNLATINESATPIWIPTGITIAALIMWGPKVWWGIFAGALLTNFTTTGNFYTSLGTATGNLTEGVVGAFLALKFIGKDIFFKPLNIFKYFLVVGVFSTFLSPLIGTTGLYLSGFIPRQNYKYTFATWWLGDMGGALIVTPFILLWERSYKLKWTLSNIAEFVVCILSISFINILIFSGWIPDIFLQTIASLFFLPFIVWIAFRFGPRETATVILIIFLIVLYGIINISSPTIHLDTNQLLLTVQVYMAIMFMTVMPLAATIYDLRKIKNMLKGRSGKYKKLIDTSPNAIYVTDLKGNIQFVNKKTLRLFGFLHRHELKGVSYFNFIAPEDLEKTKLIFKEIIRNGKVEDAEYLSVKRDNKNKFYSSTNASLLHDSDGKAEEIIFISQDITKKRQIDKMKSEFASLASHQLRTPLGSIRWSAEMIMKGDYGKIPVSVKAGVQILYESVLRLIDLVNDLLEVSRIEENRSLDNPVKINLIKILENIVASFTPLAQKNDITINFKKPRKIIFMTADQGKIFDIFENLISNSIKYNKPGGEVNITFENNSRNVRIHVKDTGIGIANKDRGKIFTKFYRSPEAARKVSDGTGLGLFIVRSYIEKLGGKVYYKSRLGKGSIFTIQISKRLVVIKGP